MTSTEPVTGSPVRSGAYTPAQTRTIAAALDLFAQHGVSGTSLQMIADAVGVTKASIYYQFKTKDEIVIAAAEADLARLEGALDAAEAEADRADALEVLLVQLIDLAIDHRRMVSILQSDPVMVRLIAAHEPFRLLMERLHTLLLGDNPRADARVPAAMLSAAISGAAMHPIVADLDDDTLRASLLDLARPFLNIAD